MAQRRASDGWDSLPNPPSVLQVTVESGPGGRAAGPRARRMQALAAVGLIAAGAVVGAVLFAGGNVGARRVVETTPPVYISSARPTPVMRGVDQIVTMSEAYRFPLGCMGATITAQALTAALRGRTGPCWRYGVFVTAILHRVDGVWRLALEATSRSCPGVALPTLVRAQLVVCRR
jgi:hypothetical protein